MELLIRPNAIDSRTVTHVLPEGPTIEEALIASGWDMALKDFTIVLLGDRDIPSSQWGDIRPKNGDKIRVMLRPSGGAASGTVPPAPNSEFKSDPAVFKRGQAPEGITAPEDPAKALQSTNPARSEIDPLVDGLSTALDPMMEKILVQLEAMMEAAGSLAE
jgi:hypothetical protein